MNFGDYYASFNEAFTSLITTGQSGMKLNCLKTFQVYYENALTTINMAERINSKGLLAVVLNSAPSCLKFVMAETCQVLKANSYPDEITALKVNKKILVVCLRESMYIHSTSDLELLVAIDTLPASYGGICAIPASVDADKCYLAYPCHDSLGLVQVMEVFGKHAIVMVCAHTNNLAAIAMNSQQTLIATASVKGTVIRVISVPAGMKLCEFRRGLKRSSQIYSLSFSSDSNYLCSSGSTGTVHVFKVPIHNLSEGSKVANFPLGSSWNPLNYFFAKGSDVTTSMANHEVKVEESWISFAGNLVASTAKFVPQMLGEVLTQERSFAKAWLGRGSFLNMSIIKVSPKHGEVYVVCGDGCLYKFTFDLSKGGECVMQNQCRISEFCKDIFFLEDHHCCGCRYQHLRNGSTHTKEKIINRINSKQSLEFYPSKDPCNQQNDHLTALDYRK